MQARAARDPRWWWARQEVCILVLQLGVLLFSTSENPKESRGECRKGEKGAETVGERWRLGEGGDRVGGGMIDHCTPP
jgi:hypothetical protein